MRKILIALLLPAALLADEPALVHPISPASIETFYAGNPTVGKAGFVKALPAEYRENWIFMINSPSSQYADCHTPRLLMFSPRPKVDDVGRPTFAMSTRLAPAVPGQPSRYADETTEMIGQNAAKTHFDMAMIHHGRANRPIDLNPKSCENCHGEGVSRRPNWETYDTWPGMLPFNRDRIYEGSEEEKAFKRILEEKAEDPIIGQLKLPKGVTRTRIENPDGTHKYRVDIDYAYNEPNPDPKAEEFEKPLRWGVTEEKRTIEHTTPNGKKIKVEQGGRYLILSAAGRGGDQSGRGNALFGDAMSTSADNAVARVKASPNYDRFKYALRAILIGCVRKPEDMAPYFPAQELYRRDEKYKLGKEGFKKFVTDVGKKRFELVKQKADRQRETLRALIRCNAQAEGKTLTDAELAEKVERELLRRPPQSNHQTDVYSDHEGYGPQVAQLAYLLEAEGIDVKRWSLAIPDSADSYTFGDIFGAYRLRLEKLTENVNVRGCDALAKASWSAFAPQAPMPRAVTTPAHDGKQ